MRFRFSWKLFPCAKIFFPYHSGFLRVSRKSRNEPRRNTHPIFGRFQAFFNAAIGYAFAQLCLSASFHKKTSNKDLRRLVLFGFKKSARIWRL